jgi:LacI family transcriptional regulator, sucrose operon repressor
MANIKDVAKLAGFSVGTVSRVLNNRGYISDETRKKVDDAMKQLNYVPNELAKSIFRQYTKIIGVIVPFITHPYFGQVVESLEFYASKINYKILLCNSYFEKDKEIEYFQMLKSNKVDGIVLGSRNMDISDIINENLPLITIDRILGDNIPCVSSDNYKGGVLATQHLINRGCKKIAHISGSPSLHLMANLRTDAFVDTCHKNGIEPIVVSTGEEQFSSMSYYNDIQNLLRDHPDIDGIFASSDIIAAQIIQVGRQNSLRIPEDIKVIGFDNTNIAVLTTPKITTICQPIEQISKYALELIINEINGEIVPMRTVLPVKLIEREST